MPGDGDNARADDVPGERSQGERQRPTRVADRQERRDGQQRDGQPLQHQPQVDHHGFFARQALDDPRREELR